ncbi:glycosyltransferase family 4 protein [Niallia nealsonii]|uniref:Glycosyltransferase family 1 protein n=1 Tax=Niallia nealsonii TaxID=115979 RepID=A0A2N0Z413_9BACI|nr:glycosyltransferase family 4 protein [Niallia nealsonii]PKG24255.1 glycosyltransferase family 1 protein [Niallia nealsonii]
MNILMIATEKLPVPPVLGGAIQTYISGSLPYLAKSYSITVLGITDPSLPNEEIKDGIKYVRVPGKLLALYQQGIVQFLASNSFDIIHIFNRPRLVMPIRSIAPQSKIILSMHNDMFNLDKIEPNEAHAAINEVSMIITISDYVGNVIRNLYPQASSKLRTIYSGVDSERFLPGNHSKMESIRNRLRKEHGLEDKNVILFAGRLSENKGVDRLIRALPLLSKKFKNLALVVVGGNWFSQNKVTDYVAYIRSLAKQQTVPVVTTGFVSPADIQNWFAAADLFVCTSIWQEPLARVHYEAMAAGLPIVTTARGGNQEVISLGENGFVIENPEDPANFAEKISEVLSNKALMQSMGKRGRELAVSNYNWSRVAHEIMEVWGFTLQMPLPTPLPDGYVAPEVEIPQNITPPNSEYGKVLGSNQTSTLFIDESNDEKEKKKEQKQYKDKDKKDKHKKNDKDKESKSSELKGKKDKKHKKTD